MKGLTADHDHGTRMRYQDGCRCFKCRLANSHAVAVFKQGGHWREARISPVGVQRRLQALYAIGWTWEALARELGLAKTNVADMAGARDRSYVFKKTAEKISALYDRLWDVYPEGVAAHRARLKAERKGWAPPLAWDPDTIDDPLAQPSLLWRDPTEMTFAERCELAELLLVEFGLPKKTIAQQAHVSYKTVAKIEREAA